MLRVVCMWSLSSRSSLTTLHMRTPSWGSTLHPGSGGSSDGRHSKRGEENSRDWQRRWPWAVQTLPAKDRSSRKTGWRDEGSNTKWMTPGDRSLACWWDGERHTDQAGPWALDTVGISQRAGRLDLKQPLKSKKIKNKQMTSGLENRCKLFLSRNSKKKTQCSGRAWVRHDLQTGCQG